MYTDLIKKCEDSKRFNSLSKEAKKRYKEEIKIAKRFYDNDRNLYEELLNKKEKIDNRYVIPYLLELTETLNLEKLPQYIQVKSGASGGIDIDSDVESNAREKIFEYLKEKYGEECVLYVGTASSLGPASAAKDILRVYGVDFKKSNSFTSKLDKMLSWEENIELLKNEHPAEYDFYLENKEILEIVPHFIDKIRQNGRHAGGIIVLPKPVYNYIPVNRVSGEIVSAFPESGQESVLDEIGVIKLDILSISILDVMKNAIDLIDEKIYLIEDDDGIEKIVNESYVNDRISTF